MDSDQLSTSPYIAQKERDELDERALQEFGDPQFNNEPLFEQSWTVQMDDMAHNVRPADLYTPSLSPAGTTNKLSNEQLRELRQIAMPTLTQSSYENPWELLPEDENEVGKKRKSFAEHEEDLEPVEVRPAKRNAHNVVEKRYRTNLNDKIAALRDAVPSLRIEKETAVGEDGSGDGDEDGANKSAQKMNKATVLTKATEYIKQLEKRNISLTEQNASMRTRIAAFEKILMSGALGIESVSRATTSHYSNKLPISEATEENQSTEGMIKVPEYIRKYNAQTQMNSQRYSVPQEHYHVKYKVEVGDQDPKSRKYVGKMMVGSLSV